jgi:glyoxylase-like metal-dependent hydrolase (beta-lactamase superfamily II)
MTAGGVRRVVLLTLGWEDLPKSVSVGGAPADERRCEPVPGVLLLCDGGWLLLDTGFNPALIRDSALRRRFHGDPGFQPILPGPGEPLEEALAEAGIAVEDIHAVGLSHLHNDHVGGLRHFAGRVPVHAQRAEVAYGLGENIEQELPIGGRVGVPPEATIEPIRRLKALAAQLDYPLIPGRDPVVWPRLTRELAQQFPPGR